MQVTFKVYRKDPEKDGKPGRSNYTVDVPDGATVLESLFKIRDEMDSSLAFRCSCLRGHCGDERGVGGMHAAGPGWAPILAGRLARPRGVG